MHTEHKRPTLTTGYLKNRKTNFPTRIQNQSTQLSVAVGRNTLWKLFLIVSLVLQVGQIFFTWMAALMHPSQKICPQTVEHGETKALMQIGQLKVGSFGATFSGTGLLTFFLCHSSDTMCRNKSVTRISRYKDHFFFAMCLEPRAKRKVKHSNQKLSTV